MDTSRIDVLTHSRIVCVGDVHGDLMALVSTLKGAGLLSCSEAFFQAACTCYTGDGRRHVGTSPVHVSRQTMNWSGGTACLVMLGDILDNQRGDETLGRCALPSTQQIMMDILELLQRQAAESGGRVSIVLGNHELANIVHAEQDMFCRHHFPSHFVHEGQPISLCIPFNGMLRTNPLWRERVKKFLIQTNAVAILVMVNNNTVCAVALHGMLSDQGCKDLECVALTGNRFQRAFGSVKNAAMINHKYWTCIASDQGELYEVMAGLRARPRLQDLPTWCRATPSSETFPAAASCYFDTMTIVKGHDIVPAEHMMKFTNDGELFLFADVAMGRSFRPQGSASAPIAFVEYKNGNWMTHNWTQGGWSVRHYN